MNAGFLLTSVLDVLKNGETQIAIVDASAACHMPDVLEMPYRHHFLEQMNPGESGHHNPALEDQPACQEIS